MFYFTWNQSNFFSNIYNNFHLGKWITLKKHKSLTFYHQSTRGLDFSLFMIDIQYSFLYVSGVIACDNLYMKSAIVNLSSLETGLLDFNEWFFYTNKSLVIYRCGYITNVVGKNVSSNILSNFKFKPPMLMSNTQLRWVLL